jgi:hypothetical protein
MATLEGHVVALRRGGAGLICYASGTDVWIVPISGCNGPPRHRAEVRIEALADIIACGLSIKYPIARCQKAYRTTVDSLAKAATRTGTAPMSLVSRVMSALRAESAARHLEDRQHFARDARAVCGAL